MKNPLAIFTGLALASLAGLVVVTMERPPNSASEKLAGGETPTVGEQPAMKTAQPPETAKLPDSKTPEDSKAAGNMMASTETKPAETLPETGAAGTKPVDNSAANAGGEASKDSLKSADPVKSPDSMVKPEFDTVRVESDGTAIVAGQAKPGTLVTLKLDGAEIGKGMANAEGAWVVIPDTPLPAGSHEITAEQKEGEGASVVSDQSVAVAVSGDGKKAPMIAVLEPGQAAKVLKSGTPVNAGQVAANQQPSTTAEQPNQGEQQQASTEPAKQQAETETVGKSTEQQASLKAAQGKKPEALSVDGVDYSDSGDIIFSGRASAGTAVRLYVDSQPVGDAIVSGGGSWSFSGQQSISPGKHSLRADQIDATGKVVAKIELPFLREESSRVAALTENDSAVTEKTDKSATAEQQQKAVEPPAVEQKQASSETSTGESQSQPETAVQSQAAKIPESSQAGEQTAKAPESSKTNEQTSMPAQSEGSVAAKPESKTEMSETAPAPDPTAEKPTAPAEQATLTAQPKAQADAGATAIEAKEPAKARSGRVVIQPHNNLWKLSRVIYGRGAHYRMIYSANKDQIRNPNRIYPGQIFTIPNASPPESIDPKRKEPLTADEGAGTVE